MRRSVIVAAIALQLLFNALTGSAQPQVCSVFFNHHGETVELSVEKLDATAQCAELSSLQKFRDSMEPFTSAANPTARVGRFWPYELRFELPPMSVATSDPMVISHALTSYVFRSFWNPLGEPNSIGFDVKDEDHLPNVSVTVLKTNTASSTYNKFPIKLIMNILPCPVTVLFNLKNKKYSSEEFLTEVLVNKAQPYGMYTTHVKGSPDVEFEKGRGWDQVLKTMPFLSIGSDNGKTFFMNLIMEQAEKGFFITRYTMKDEFRRVSA